MQLKIAGKGSVKNLLAESRLDCDYYELYLETVDDFLASDVKKLQDRAKIVSVHQPSYVRINNKLVEFNLLGDSLIGKKSVEVLKNTLKTAKETGIKIVVLHGIRFNHQQYSLKLAIDRLAKIIDQMPNRNLLSLETDLLWRNTFNEKYKPLVISNGAIASIAKQIKANLTLDVEHVIITSFFLQFIKEEESLKLSLKEFEKQFNKWVKKNTDEKIKKIYRQLESFTNQFKNRINHIHINGSNWFNYFLDEKLPFKGEHLPIKYQSKNINDQLNYQQLFKCLNKLANKKIYAVLEIDLNPKRYHFFSEMIKSKKRLEKIWRLNEQGK